MDDSKLKPGDHHYKAYVGPPDQYDLMGATQFNLLTTLGLRANHSLLDFGCGSLRAGKLFIPYLDKDKYCGIDPNTWLVEEGIDYEVGKDLLRIKNPCFNFNKNFKTDVFDQQFDFILAQSIFSHASGDNITIILKNFKESLNPSGLIAANFLESEYDYIGEEWIYPACATYRPSTIQRFAEEAKLFIIKIPWYHPRQTWYLLSRDKCVLPDRKKIDGLEGFVF